MTIDNNQFQGSPFFFWMHFFLLQNMKKKSFPSSNHSSGSEIISSELVLHLAAAAGNVSVYSSKDVRLEKKMKQQQEGNRVEEFLSTSTTTTKAEAVDDDTIAAIVTAMGGGSHQGAVAIVRLSGPSAVKIAARHFFPSKQVRNHHNPQDLNVLLPWRPKSHRVEHGLLRDASGTLIDEVCNNPYSMWSFVLISKLCRFGFWQSEIDCFVICGFVLQ
jgi:hypothetical protein